MRRWNNSARFLTIGVHSATATENDMRKPQVLPKSPTSALHGLRVRRAGTNPACVQPGEASGHQEIFLEQCGAHRTRQRERSQLDTHRVWRKLRALLSLRMEALPCVGGQKQFKHADVSWRCPFQMRDAIGFIVNGQASEHGQRWRFRFPAAELQSATTSAKYLGATVVYANGRRANLPVALRTPEGESPIRA